MTGSVPYTGTRGPLLPTSLPCLEAFLRFGESSLGVETRSEILVLSTE